MVVKKKTTVKKTAVKSKPVAKKPIAAAVKKVVKAKKAVMPVKAVAVEAPKAMPTPATKKCGIICWKKVCIFLLGVVIGAGAIIATSGQRKHNMMKMHSDMFKDGCLDVSKIRGQKRIDALRARGLDTDGCITKEQFFGDKMERMNQEGERVRPMPRGEGRAKRAPRGQRQ
jgi:hypothetical protein